MNGKKNQHTERQGGGAARGMVRSQEAKDHVRRGQEEVRPSVTKSVERSVKDNARLWTVLSKH